MSGGQGQIGQILAGPQIAERRQIQNRQQNNEENGSYGDPVRLAISNQKIAQAV
jgi:hypothetical protein